MEEVGGPRVYMVRAYIKYVSILEINPRFGIELRL